MPDGLWDQFFHVDLADHVLGSSVTAGLFSLSYGYTDLCWTDGGPTSVVLMYCPPA